MQAGESQFVIMHKNEYGVTLCELVDGQGTQSLDYYMYNYNRISVKCSDVKAI